MNENVKFFIDTGDVEYCKKVYNNLKPFISGKEVVGVTTNPSALFKINVKNFKEMETIINNLCCFVTEVRKDTNGVVYVQLPNSNISIEDAEKYINLITNFTDGNTKVGLKIPPYQKYLKEASRWSKIIDINVTGVADCSTALRCFTYPVRYVSIIPGRMEEQGLDANSQLGYIDKRAHNDNELITGSMRTLSGLRNAIVHNTIPTIGWRVFDKIIEENLVESFLNYWNEPKINTIHELSPDVNRINAKLSVDFFNQMDEFGSTLYSCLTHGK